LELSHPTSPGKVSFLHINPLNHQDNKTARQFDLVFHPEQNVDRCDLGQLLHDYCQTSHTFNDLMWVAHDLLYVRKAVIAFVASSHDEVELTEPNYPAIKHATRVIFRVEKRPTLQQLVDQELMEEAASSTLSGKQVGSTHPEFPHNIPFLLTRA
jgi:hypothetical protein